MKVSNQCNLWCGIAYSTVGILGCLLYSSDLDISILVNLGHEDMVCSEFLLLIFMIVIACHIPYIFYPCKETMLVMIDEITNQSMSKEIEGRLSFQGQTSQNSEKQMSYKNMENQ